MYKINGHITGMQEELDEFKEAYSQKSDGDLYYQVKYLSALAETYHIKAIENRSHLNNWTNFVRAHSLYNSCLVRIKNEGEANSMTERRSWVEKDFMDSICFTEEQFQLFKNIGEQFKDRLHGLREELRKRINEFKIMEEKYDLKSIGLDSMTDLESKFIQKIKELSTFSSNEISIIFASIIQKAEQVSGTPPCAYEVIGCGSLARGEMTPYSDLEFFIIHEEELEDKKYFINMSVIVYFILCNLGETNLHYMHISELIGWFKDDATNGLKIDGLMPHAGNIPTGNGLEGCRILINSPQELADIYKSELSAPSKASIGINGNLGGLLCTTIKLYHSYSSDELYQEFLRLKSETDKELLTDDSSAMLAKLDLLRNDISKHNFYPKNKSHHFEGHTEHKIKSEIYRYPTILLNDLKIILQEDEVRTPWEMIEKLNAKNILSDENAHHMEFLVAICIYTRQAGYLFFNSQKDSLCFLKHRMDENILDRYYMQQQWFIGMASILVPLKTNLQDQDEKLNSRQGVIDRLKDLKISRNDPVTLSLVYSYQGDHESCYNLFRNSLKKSEDIKQLHTQLAVLYDDVTVWRILLILAYAARRNCEYDEADKIYRYLSTVDPPNKKAEVAYCNNLAIVQYLEGDYNGALLNFNKAIDIDEQKDYGCGAKNNLARVLTRLGRHAEALSYFNECAENIYANGKGDPLKDSFYLTVLLNIANVHVELNKLDMAIEKHRFVLKHRKSLYGDDAAHSHIATSHDCLGWALYLANQLDEALHMLQKGLKMRLKIYTEESGKKAHTALAFSYQHLGEYYIITGDFKSAITSLLDCIKIRKTVFGSTRVHIDKAIALAMLAEAYEHEGEMHRAYEICVEARSQIPERNTDPRKASDLLTKLNSLMDHLKLLNIF